MSNQLPGNIVEISVYDKPLEFSEQLQMWYYLAEKHPWAVDTDDLENCGGYIP